MPEPTALARKIAAVAQAQYDRFRFVNEADPELCQQIKRWTQEIGFPFRSCASEPWASLFVSWCVREAGATRAQFEFAAAASVFTHRAIRNAEVEAAGFRGFDVATHAPHVGDIIVHNRGGGSHDFDFARTHKSYPSHPVIVVEVGQDADGPHASCVGGNEGDSVRQTTLRLGPDGLLLPREESPFICVIHPPG